MVSTLVVWLENDAHTIPDDPENKYVADYLGLEGYRMQEDGSKAYYFSANSGFQMGQTGKHFYTYEDGNV